MRNMFTVHSETLEEFPSKTAPGGVGKSRRVILLDASNDGKPMAQFWELNLPGDHPEVGKGAKIGLEIVEVSRIFRGRPQVRGTIITLNGKPFGETPAAGK